LAWLTSLTASINFFNCLDRLFQLPGSTFSTGWIDFLTGWIDFFTGWIDYFNWLDRLADRFASTLTIRSANLVGF
jgi:hypothetical protein